jgi:hypothetical protein
MTRKLILLLLVLALILAIPMFPTARAASNPNAPTPNINPLTGLPVSDPAKLALPPALVSISNFPASTRPQAGLSSAPIVFETYIGEGMTRFLAIFYGDYPTQAANSTGGLAQDNQVVQNAASDAAVGPIRSGRISYENIRKLYNGFLVMAGGYAGVLQRLNQYTNVYGADKNDVNSAMIPVAQLEKIAQANSKKLDASALTGMAFNAQPPANGKAGEVIWLPYSYYNQIFWRYNPDSGAYNRYQDKADAKTFIQATDRLTGQPLTFENVVILFANHEKISNTVFDLNLRYIDQAPALIFRDGQVHEIFWTTANGDYEKETGQVRPIRFIDAQGQPFPLKPGQTWIETVTPATYYFETTDSLTYYDLMKNRQPGSGIWTVRFMAP